ncbi:hypothetical protein Xhom_04948 [Xenorhabdus hominickii]|uniref:Uncharacterized protein n=1 Tax=Xenorhabdus hominickii TaxID=351679 RepID=A0A2G0PWE9_XENHO|nr:hypothetical protein Xhom_04948 [Xenorhabdus hominickii]
MMLRSFASWMNKGLSSVTKNNVIGFGMLLIQKENKSSPMYLSPETMKPAENSLIY